MDGFESYEIISSDHPGAREVLRIESEFAQDMAALAAEIGAAKYTQRGFRYAEGVEPPGYLRSYGSGWEPDPGRPRGSALAERVRVTLEGRYLAHKAASACFFPKMQGSTGMMWSCTLLRVGTRLVLRCPYACREGDKVIGGWPAPRGGIPMKEWEFLRALDEAGAEEFLAEIRS